MTQRYDKPGRPKTGRSTVVRRIDDRVDVDKAVEMYLEWLPVIERYAQETSDSPRCGRLNQMLNELGLR